MLVDYFVELSVPEDKHISTSEMKKMFHDALKVAPARAEQPQYEDDDFDVDRSTPKQTIKETYLLGQFKLDPVSTDFIGKALSLPI